MKTKSTLLFVVAAFLVLVSAAQQASAQPAQNNAAQSSSEAKRHLDEGLKFFRAQKYSDAVVEFKEAVRIDPTSAEYHHALGAAFHAMERYAEAETEKRLA